MFPSQHPWRQRQWQQGDFSSLGTRHGYKVLSCQQVGGFHFCSAVLEPWHGHSGLICKLPECQTHSHWFSLSAPHPGWLSSIESEVAQSCPTLCELRDHSLPGSAVHGIFQARILEWAAIAFSWGSSQPRDRTRVHCRQRLYRLSHQGSPTKQYAPCNCTTVIALKYFLDAG